jgi:hypothetical protein
MDIILILIIYLQVDEVRKRKPVRVSHVVAFWFEHDSDSLLAWKELVKPNKSNKRAIPPASDSDELAKKNRKKKKSKKDKGKSSVKHDPENAKHVGKGEDEGSEPEPEPEKPIGRKNRTNSKFYLGSNFELCHCLPNVVIRHASASCSFRSCHQRRIIRKPRER